MNLSACKKQIQDLRLQFDALTGTILPASIGICDMDRKVLRCRTYGGELCEREAVLLIPERLEKLLFPKRLKIIFGGRGSSKTRTISSLLVEMIRYEGLRVVVLREILRSVPKSSYKEMSDEIDRRLLRSTEMTVTNTEIRSNLSKGEAIFLGLKNNVTALKGLAAIDLAWCDESENVSQTSLDTLFPTIRAEDSEIWISFNPRFKNDPSWKLVESYYDLMKNGIYEDEYVLIIECNYSNNPWLPLVLKLERDKMKEHDYDRYMYIWEGKFNIRSDSQIMKGKWEIKGFEVDSDWEMFCGLDFGFVHPSAFVQMYLDDREEILYVRREFGGSSIDTDELAKLIKNIPFVDDSRIYADNSRPETISALRNLDIDVFPAEKGEGSVLDGIAYLRSLNRIVIHPDCPSTANNFEDYNWKVDPVTEEIMEIIIKENDDFIDAIRYGLWKEIKSRYSILSI